MIRRIAILALALASLISWKPARADNSDIFNLRFGPAGLLTGHLKVAGDFRVGSDWTLGPELWWSRQNYASNDSTFTSDFKVTTYTIAARANWFKNGTFTDGIYLGPSLKFANSEVKVSDSSGDRTGKVNGLAVGLLVGYGWFWHTFNMMLGVGYDLGISDNSNVSVSDVNGNSHSASTSLTGLDGEFTLGWTF